jgi:uncharacterized membrane protein
MDCALVKASRLRTGRALLEGSKERHNPETKTRHRQGGPDPGQRRSIQGQLGVETGQTEPVAVRLPGIRRFLTHGPGLDLGVVLQEWMQFTTEMAPAPLSNMNNDRHPAAAAPTLKLERLVAFSDAVLAIVITLLVLGLNVPDAHKIPEKQLPDYLADSIPSIIAYITSFVLVGMYWLQHFVIFHYVLHANRTLILLNGLFLLSVSFLPFPTGLQAVYREDRLAVVFFGCAHILCGLTLLVLWLYATQRRRLVAVEVSRQVVQSMTLRIALGPTLSVLAMAVSFYSVWAGKLFFLVIPVCYLSHRLVDAGWQSRQQL